MFSIETILELASFYLGADVEVSDLYLLRLRPGLTRAEYSSMTWHHDNCGNRLKLLVFSEDVGEDRPALGESCRVRMAGIYFGT